MNKLEEQVQYVIDNFEVKTFKQMSNELGVPNSRLNSWVVRMRDLGVKVPRKSNIGLVTAAIQNLKVDPRNVSKIQEWNSR